jgi:hypothetical protein
VIRCIEVLLAIPDNEAHTALATLQRLGVALDALERGDLYRCEVEPAEVERLVESLRGFETIFNPNKHVLRVRQGEGPGAGEVWVDECGNGGDAASGGAARIAGRALPGVRSLERFTAWRLFAEPGVPAGPDVVRVATDTLLCNPAFQKATTA